MDAAGDMERDTALGVRREDEGKGEERGGVEVDVGVVRKDSALAFVEREPMGIR